MKNWVQPLAIFIAGIALYAALVSLIGFEGPIAAIINVGRIALALAVLVIYIPMISIVFQEIPPPRRDYLLVGIILSWLSSLCFAFWNEAGRQFGVTTSIFVSPIAGFFSLLLVAGGLFHMLAPDMGGRKLRAIAIAIGIAVGIAVAIGAPLLR